MENNYVSVDVNVHYCFYLKKVYIRIIDDTL